MYNGGIMLEYAVIGYTLSIAIYYKHTHDCVLYLLTWTTIGVASLSINVTSRASGAANTGPYSCPLTLVACTTASRPRSPLTPCSDITSICMKTNLQH